MSVGLSSYPASATDTDTTLRLAQIGQSISTLDTLLLGATELSRMVEQGEQDSQRLRQRMSKFSQLGSAAARAVEGQRVAAEAEAVRQHVGGLRTALASLRADMRAVGEQELPQAEREQLAAQLRADEHAAEAVAQDVSKLFEAARTLGQDRMQAKEAPAARATGMVATELPTAEAAADSEGVQPPASLRAQLQGFARDMRALAYSDRPPAAGNIDGSAQTDSRVAQLQGRFAQWSEQTRAPQMMDPNEMTQWIMRQAYVDNSQDMRSYAYKLQFQTALKSALRDELQQVRQFRSSHGPASDDKDKKLTEAYSRKRIRRDPEVGSDGVWRVRPVSEDGEIVDDGALQEYIRDLETALSSCSDDMQIAQLELQAMTQRQQQVLNALSNLSKSLHETSMAILRKIGN